MADHPLDPLLAHVAGGVRDVITVQGPGGELRLGTPALLQFRPRGADGHPRWVDASFSPSLVGGELEVVGREVNWCSGLGCHWR